MSPLFNFRKEPKQIYTDDGLEQLTQNDGYWRVKLLRDVITYVACGLIVLFAVAIIYEYIFDLAFRNFVIGEIKDSFEGIVFFVLSMIGITYNIKGKNLK